MSSAIWSTDLVLRKHRKHYAGKHNTRRSRAYRRKHVPPALRYHSAPLSMVDAPRLRHGVPMTSALTKSAMQRVLGPLNLDLTFSTPQALQVQPMGQDPRPCHES